MKEFLVNNAGTIVVLLAVISVSAGIIIKLVRDKKNGASSCGCNCADCPAAGNCNKNN